MSEGGGDRSGALMGTNYGLSQTWLEKEGRRERLIRKGELKTKEGGEIGEGVH